MTTTGDGTSLHDIRGFTAPGFEDMREAFASAAEIDRRGGSALSVVRDGELVVELVTGSGTDAQTPRTASSTQTCFSCTKGIVATALLILIERGQLELDAPVARYWPEFAEHGKPDVLVRHVVSHMSGQPSFRGPVAIDDLTDDELVESVVARDEPWWPAGTALSYQSLTYGPLCGGLIRRITGESVGSFVQREIATPLRLDLWIGLPEQREGDVAPLYLVPESEQELLTDNPAQRAKALNPPVLRGDGGAAWNTRAFHAAEIPAAGGITTATALARLYGCLALGGTLDGHQLLRPETVELGRTTLATAPDVLGDDSLLSFGVGFMRPTVNDPAYDPLEFGHGGYGGQDSVAWPSHRTGVAYLTTALRGGDVTSNRSAGVLSSLHRILARSS
jgi:CubicO group peptidase (beta-lactamase class C family)